jgi:hypothetical protein
MLSSTLNYYLCSNPFCETLNTFPIPTMCSRTRAYTSRAKSPSVIIQGRVFFCHIMAKESGQHFLRCCHSAGAKTRLKGLRRFVPNMDKNRVSSIGKVNSERPGISFHLSTAAVKLPTITQTCINERVGRVSLRCLQKMSIRLSSARQ